MIEGLFIQAKFCFLQYFSTPSTPKESSKEEGVGVSPKSYVSPQGTANQIKSCCEVFVLPSNVGFMSLSRFPTLIAGPLRKNSSVGDSFFTPMSTPFRPDASVGQQSNVGLSRFLQQIKQFWHPIQVTICVVEVALRIEIFPGELGGEESVCEDGQPDGSVGWVGSLGHFLRFTARQIPMSSRLSQHAGVQGDAAHAPSGGNPARHFARRRV